MSAEAKRIRGMNFSPREVSHLFTIALQYKNILENKQTNSITNTQKNEAWVEIAKEFNATSSDLNNRTMDQLKRCYENKKQAMRKKKAQIRQEVLKTGGGLPPPETKCDNLDDLVLATMDPITVEGHYNQFDSDAICPILGTNTESVEYVFENSITDFEEECMSSSSGPQIKKGVSSTAEAKKALDNTAQLPSCSLAESSNRNALSPIETNIEQNLLPTSNEAKSTEKINWKHFSTNDLKRPLNPLLLQPGMRNKNEMESEDQQVNNRAAGSQIIEDQYLKSKRNIENVGGRGDKRRRGTSTKGPDRRRPTATLVRTLASNALAEKYEYLADKKNIIADYTIKKLERERLYAEEEHHLRKECLQLDVDIRKKQLERLSR